MLAASIMGLQGYVPELSQVSKYFAVEMYILQRSSSDNSWSFRKVGLEQCTTSHFDLPQY